MTVPPLSVVLPVHNAEPYLDACIASILAQDFRDIELVALDDASTDRSSEILLDWAARDKRVRIERNETRQGPVGSSNRIVGLARAPLVARIDADDVMLPGRLSTQVAAFAREPSAVMIGGLAWTIDAAGCRVRAPDLARLTRNNRFAPFPHSSVMFRREAWELSGGYRAGTEKWEDVDFFLRMAAQGPVWTIAAPLVEYRQSLTTTRLSDGLSGLEGAMDAMSRAVAGLAATASGRIALDAYRHIGGTMLWSGGQPRLLARIVRNGAIGCNGATMRLLGWAALAGTMPGALRGLLRGHLERANRKARRQLGEVDMVRWVPSEAPSPPFR